MKLFKVSDRLYGSRLSKEKTLSVIVGTVSTALATYLAGALMRHGVELGAEEIAESIAPLMLLTAAAVNQWIARDRADK